MAGAKSATFVNLQTGRPLFSALAANFTSPIHICASERLHEHHHADSSRSGTLLCSRASQRIQGLQPAGHFLFSRSAHRDNVATCEDIVPMRRRAWTGTQSLYTTTVVSSDTWTDILRDTPFPHEQTPLISAMLNTSTPANTNGFGPCALPRALRDSAYRYSH